MKKFLALTLALVMVLSLLPSVTMAMEQETTIAAIIHGWIQEHLEEVEK